MMFYSRCRKEPLTLSSSSSSRPDNLALTAITTMKDIRTSSVSQPIPVPSQIHNYEKMQESRDRTKSVGATSAGSPNDSPYDGISGFIFILNRSTFLV